MARILSAVLVSLSVLGCADDADVTSTRIAWRLRDANGPDAGLLVAEAQWAVRAVRLRPCPAGDVQGAWTGVPDGKDVWPGLAFPRPATLGFDAVRLTYPVAYDLPFGTWCSLEVVSEGPLTLDVVTPEGEAVAVTVTMPDLGLPFEVAFGDVSEEVASDGSGRTRSVVYPLIIELGTAFWEDTIVAAVAAGDTEIAPGTPDHDLLRGDLVVGAALYRDVDGDGLLSDDERTSQRLSGLVAF